MSTLSELRLQRSDDSSEYTDNRSLSSRQRYAREAGARAPSFRGDALHYREDYGASMDDQTYSAMNEEKKGFETKISSAQGELNKSTESVNKQYQEGLKKINETHASIPAYGFEGFYSNYLKNTAIPIALYNGSSYEGTYLMDPNSASSFLSEVNKSGYYRVFKTDKGQTAVDVRGYGKEIHEPLLEYSNKLKPAAKEAYDKQYGIAVNDIKRAEGIEKKSALNTLNTGYAGAQATLAQQQEQLNNVIIQNKNYYTSIKDKYREKLATIKDTIFAIG